MAHKKPVYEVFVGNLPSNVTEATLTPLFTEVGEVSSIRLRNSHDGRKVAYVRYFIELDADAAVAKRNGYLFGNNRLHVHRIQKSTRLQQSEGNPAQTGGGSTDSKMKGMALSAILGSAQKVAQKKESSNIPSAPENAGVELLICEVKDATSFFGQQPSDSDKAAELAIQLAEICPTTVPETSPELEKIYAAKFSEDQQWYRCKVLQKIDNTKSYIQYLDYGNCEEISHGPGLVSLSGELALIPPLAIFCCFDGLQSFSKDNDPALYNEALNFMKVLLRDNKVKVRTKTRISRQTTNLVTSCHLLDSGLDVIEEFRNRGYAKKMQPTKDAEQQISCAESSPDRGYQRIPERSTYPARDRSDSCDRGYSSEHNQHGFGRGFNGGRLYGPGQSRFITPLSRPNYPGCDDIKNGVWARFSAPKPEMLHGSGGQAWMKNQPELRMVPAQSMRPAAAGGGDTSTTAVKQLSDERNFLKSQLQTMKDRIKALEEQIAANDSLCQAKNNTLSKLPDILMLLGKVKLQREQFSTDPDVKDIVEMALNIYETCRQVAKPNHSVDSAVTRYQAAQEAIEKCCDLGQLPPLRAERDAASEELRQQLQAHKEIAKDADQANSRKVLHIKVALTELERAFGELLAVSVDSSLDIAAVPLTFDELSQSIARLKMEKGPGFQRQRQKTDTAHVRLVTFLQELLQALRSAKAESGGKQFSVSCIDGFVEDLERCLQAEVSECNLISSASCGRLGVLVRQLVAELQETLSRLSDAVLAQDRYSSLLQELGFDNSLLDFKDCERKAMEACQLRRNVRRLKSALRHRLADLEDIEFDEVERDKVTADIRAVRIRLQGVFSEEEQLLDQLSRLLIRRFPELVLLFPELELPEYQKFNSLLKSQWELFAFEIESCGPQLKTTFCEEDMLIIEYAVGTSGDLDVLLMKVTQYSYARCSHLLPIKAVFFPQDQRHVYIMVPSMGKPLVMHARSVLPHLTLLHDILSALHVLHTPLESKPPIGHGRVHPAWILLSPDSKSVVLDLPDFSVYMLGKSHQLPVAGRIDFTAPELRIMNVKPEPTPASDMFAFGCLMLWLMFPGAVFKQGCLETLGPAEEMARTRREVSVIRSLLKENPTDRPTAAQLLENPVFAGFSKVQRPSTATSVAVKAKLSVAQTLSLPSEH
ncbi:serine/threonine-protein kinase 31-like isoform X2 [Dermacentor silvarum]|uniref:serine/threonine-protein kinase 31-like isoform X2 n=1 Tax=Dermacentor silvarum TaxID=543639 RepID=UPI002101C7D5|nr:serine/threonine-protein kinase 31-like isoform X2 [Dermacentor silvarum]